MRHRRGYEWLRRRPGLVDAVSVLPLGLVVVVLDSGLFNGEIAAGLVAIALCLPLAWRRRAPVTCFVLVSLACLAQLLLLDRPLLADVGFLLALYAVSAHTTRRWARAAALAVGGLAAVLAPLDWNGSSLSLTWTSFLVPFVVQAALVAFSWTLGDLMRTRRAYVGELEDRARRLEVERDQQQRLGRAAERARIAREMHDVVAHSLSVMVAQADGGLYAGRTDPRAARSALATIGTTGRQALDEMRRLLGVLRTEGQQVDGGPDPTAAAMSDLAPQPGLAQLPDLVAQVRASGLPVQVTVDGEERRLAGGTELAAYRVVQEALTNTLRHGGPAASAQVRVRYGTDALHIQVSDDGRGAAAQGDGKGQGIDGMRERIALYGGQLRAGPRRGGGFEVVAVLALDADRQEAGERA